MPRETEDGTPAAEVKEGEHATERHARRLAARKKHSSAKRAEDNVQNAEQGSSSARGTEHQTADSADKGISPAHDVAQNPLSDAPAAAPSSADAGQSPAATGAGQQPPTVAHTALDINNLPTAATANTAQQLMQPTVPQRTAPIQSGRTLLSGIAQWFKSTFHAGNGGLRAFPTWKPDTSSDTTPADAKMLLQTAATLASLVPSYKSVHPQITVPVTDPVLGVRIGRLLGSSPDAYVTKPFVRISVVDTRTGRLLVPSTVVKPTQLPRAPPIPQGIAQQVGYDATSLSTTPPGCLSLGGEFPHTFNRNAFVSPVNTGPAFNRELDVDIISAVTDVAGRDLLTELELKRVTMSKTSFGSGFSGASDSASLLWDEYVVLNCPLADALQPYVAIMVELLDEQATLPRQELRQGRGSYRIGWGYLKLINADGVPNIDVQQAVPLGFLPQMIVPTAEDDVSDLLPPFQISDLHVPLFGFRGPSWADRVDHAATISPCMPGFESPSPEVSIQYRTRDRLPIDLSLEIAVFSAIIPSCRYVHKTGEVPIITYFDGRGDAIQTEMTHHLWPELHTAQDKAVSLSLHASKRRPNAAIKLPTDVVLEHPVDTGSSAAPLKVVPKVEESRPVKPHPTKFARAKNEYCLQPDVFICSVPTGKLGAMSVSFSPDGLLVAFGCADDTGYPIRIYQTDIYREVITLAGHAGLVYQLSWSPDSQWLASSSSDGTVNVWYISHSEGDMAFSDVPRKPYSQCLHMPASYVYAAKFHPSAPHLLVSGAFDRGIRLWDTLIDATTRKPVLQADGSALFERQAELIGFIGEDPKSVPLNTFEAHRCHDSHVNVIEFDTAVDGSAKRLITADGVGAIMIWDITKGAPDDPEAYGLVKTLKPAALRGVPVVSVKVRPGYNQMMVLGHQNILRLFDLATFGAVRAYPNARCTVSHLDMTFSPDGTYLACGGEDGVLSLWSVDKGEAIVPRARIDDGRRALIAFPGVMYGVSWHPDQHVVAVCAFGAAYPGMVCGAFSMAGPSS